MKKHIVLYVMAIAGIIGFSEIARADLNDGLVAYYPFNGNANDESGNGNNGAVNGATLTNDRFGNTNSAYDFNGVDHFIAIQNENIGHLSTGTISMFFSLNSPLDSTLPGQWVLTSDPQGDTDGDIVLAINRTNCDGGPTLGNGKLNFETQGDHANTNYCAANLVQLLSVTDSWSTDWYHVVITFNGETMKMYINNTLESTINTTSGAFNVANHIYIGGYHEQYLGNYFHGSIDDIRIYNRALSEAEIQQLAEYTVPISPGIIPIDGTPISVRNKFGELTASGSQLFDPTKKIYVISHGWNPNRDELSLPSWVQDTGTDIAMKGMVSKGNVLLWNWQAKAVSDHDGDDNPFIDVNENNDIGAIQRALGVPYDNVRDSGKFLAEAIRNYIFDNTGSFNYNGQMHLIGHSLGSGVVINAALELKNNYNIKQLTLLDSPWYAKHPAKDLKTELNGMFVDNYWSGLGRPQGYKFADVNVYLVPERKV